MAQTTAFQFPAPSVRSYSSRYGVPATCCQRDAATSRRAFLQGVLRISTGASILSVSSARASASKVESPESVPSIVDTKPKKLAWGYVDDIGPDAWGSLTEDWALCDTGKRQSPIALSYKEARIASELTPRPTVALTAPRARMILLRREAMPYAIAKSLIIEPYVPPPPKFVGDAPPVDVGAKPPSPAMLTLPGVGRYSLMNLHFHTGGSEHVLNGSRARMEGHFVFALDKSAPASESDSPDSAPPLGAGSSNVVVGVMFSKGKTTTPWLASILANTVKSTAGEDADGANRVMELDLEEALGGVNEGNLYTYDGSLTTPPGAEGVHWVVMGQRATVTEEDCMLLEKYQGGPNTRPLQKAGGRQIVQFPAVLRE